MSDDADNPNGSDGDAESAEESTAAMLEAALQDLSREEIERQKYDDPERGIDLDADDVQTREENQSPEDSPDENSIDEEAADEDAEGSAEDEQARQRRRDREMFERAMADVDRLDDDSKYRSPSTPDPDEATERASAASRRTVDDLKTPPLPKSGDKLRQAPPLDEEQQALKSRFNAWERDTPAPEINLRGDTTDDAISRLTSFLAQARHHEARFVRIITGRGRRSDGPPALKLAVLEWLEGRGIHHIDGYIPERLLDGDYGSLIVELRDVA